VKKPHHALFNMAHHRASRCLPNNYFSLLSGGVPGDWRSGVPTTFFPVSPTVVSLSAEPPEEVEAGAEDLASFGLPGVVLLNVDPLVVD
jgi:hypothetical protein